MKARAKRVLTFWGVAFLFSVLVVEIILSGIVLDRLLGVESPVLRSIGTLFALVVYYAFITLLLSIVTQLKPLSWRVSLLLFFTYGVLIELLFFKTIHSLGEAVGFGLLYVFMFGVPLWITLRLTKKR